MADQEQPYSSTASGTYVPSTEDQEIISKILSRREKFRRERQVHEPTWFVNAAFFRGNQYLEWMDQVGKTAPAAVPHRVRLKINRMQAKLRARNAKFLKNRPKILVVPGTNEYNDYLNAKATQRAFDYLWRKLRVEDAYEEALSWTRDCGRGLWWFHWDPTKMARTQIQDPATGVSTYAEEQLGDVIIEAGSTYELLVADPGVTAIGRQPEIMRLKLRDVEDAKQMFQDYADFIVGEKASDETFKYEDQVASLSSYGPGLGRRKVDSRTDKVLVTEDFIHPNGKYPKGAYRVLVGSVLVKSQDELPYGFWDMENPFPCECFVDMKVAGQFWGPTIAEQLVDLQREYNLLRSKNAEHLRVMAFPKIFVAKQHQLMKGQWNAEAGQFIEYVAIPNVPPPQPWTPPPISTDVWQSLNLLQKEFDDISQIHPVTQGASGGTTSGFQTNLLQEAADSVHAPDVRAHERVVEQAAMKLRRMIKLGYQQPRLIAALGANYEHEVFEFSSAQVDEYADIVVEAGSALPTLKASKQDTVLNLYKSGLFGDPGDPEVRRRALGLLEMGSLEEAFDQAKGDENQARWENVLFSKLQPVEPPHFYENHQIHYNSHTTWLKSPEGKASPLQARRSVTAHVLLHGRFINPNAALQAAASEGIEEVVPIIQSMLPPPAQTPGPGGPPPQGAPQAPAPPGVPQAAPTPGVQ